MAAPSPWSRPRDIKQRRQRRRRTERLQDYTCRLSKRSWSAFCVSELRDHGKHVYAVERVGAWSDIAVGGLRACEGARDLAQTACHTKVRPCLKLRTL